MKTDTNTFCIMLLAILLLPPLAIAITNEVWMHDAIKRGFAEFVITNPTTGTTKWQWKEQAKK
jgi:hypothetical protein